MLELADRLLPRVRAGERMAAVTVTAVVRGAPRGPGASLAVTASGEVIGSISGGCVESDAVALALDALAAGRARTARLGFTDETGHAAGLACGGAVEVLAYPVDGSALDALDAASAGRDTAIAIDRVTGGIRLVAPGEHDGSEVVVRHRPPQRLIVAGASEHAAALCRIAAAAGFAVTVVDPWELLVTPARFPAASVLVVAEPARYLEDPGPVDERTAVCVLTHDERLDVPALEVALRMPVGFVGAMGARSTVARRRALLLARGVTDAELARLHSPLGLDLGGASVDDAAVSALAEILAVRHGGTGRSLRELPGPLHHRMTADDVDCAVPAGPRPDAAVGGPF